MDLHWGIPHTRKYATVDNILKIINVLKYSHFALFPHVQYALKDTHYNEFLLCFLYLCVNERAIFD